MVDMVMAGCQYLFDEYMNEGAWYSQVRKALSQLSEEVATAFGEHLHVSV